jgi:hypothetical protein
MEALDYNTLRSQFGSDVQRAVRLRAADCCEACGAPLDRGGAFLPVVRYSRDALPEEVMTSAANAVLLCIPCEELAEARDPWMEILGFSHSRGSDPRLEPMVIPGTRGCLKVWRGTDGLYHTDPPDGASRAR